MQDEEPFHLDTNMENLEVDEEHKIVKQVIMEKDSDIKELKDNSSKAKFLISFLEQENMQLKVNKLPLNMHKVDGSKEDVKGNVEIDIDDLDEHEEQVRLKRRRNRGLQQQREGDNHFFGVSFDIESAMVIFFGE